MSAQADSMAAELSLRGGIDSGNKVLLDPCDLRWRIDPSKCEAVFTRQEQSRELRNSHCVICTI